MGDLTNLKPEELLDAALWNDGTGTVLRARAEIRSRLGRLEQCEAELAIAVRTMKQYEAALTLNQADHDTTEKRLERYEAVIAQYQTAHDAKMWEGGLSKRCRCTACDAARAALEE